MTKRKNPKSPTKGEDRADADGASSVLPPRPYTEYSIFFRIERAYLLQKAGTVEEGVLASVDLSHHDPVEHPRPARYRSILLPPYWYSSSGGAMLSKRPRDHKKKGGLDRKALNKIVSVMWKQVDPEVKAYCKRLARAGLERYNAVVEQALKRLIGGEAAEGTAAPSKRPKMYNAGNTGAADLQDFCVKKQAKADIPGGSLRPENLVPNSRIKTAKDKNFILQQQKQSLGPVPARADGKLQTCHGANGSQLKTGGGPNVTDRCAVEDEQDTHHGRATGRTTTTEVWESRQGASGTPGETGRGSNATDCCVVKIEQDTHHVRATSHATTTEVSKPRQGASGTPVESGGGSNVTNCCVVKVEQDTHHVRATSRATTAEIIDLTAEEQGGGGFEEQNRLTPPTSSSEGVSLDPEHEMLQLQEQIQSGLGQLTSLSERLEILRLQQQQQYCLELLTSSSKRLEFLKNRGPLATPELVTSLGPNAGSTASGFSGEGGLLGQDRDQIRNQAFIIADNFPARTFLLITHLSETAPEVSSFSSDGSTFEIYDKSTFAQKYLPQYFNHSNYGSFVRQMNLYGFTCSRSNKFIIWSHDYFRRDRKDLIKEIKRIKAPKRTKTPHVHVNTRSLLPPSVILDRKLVHRSSLPDIQGSGPDRTRQMSRQPARSHPEACTEARDLPELARIRKAVEDELAQKLTRSHPEAGTIAKDPPEPARSRKAVEDEPAQQSARSHPEASMMKSNPPEVAQIRKALEDEYPLPSPAHIVGLYKPVPAGRFAGSGEKSGVWGRSPFANKI